MLSPVPQLSNLYNEENMNKQEILNKYDNEDDKLLISKLLDKIEFVEKKNSVENTDFLDMRQRNIVEKVLKNIKYKNYIIYGGYENAERTMIILYPEKLETVFENNYFDYNNIVQVLRIILPNEMRGKYSHRDYLGAIIKVGLKREKIGDVLVNINGADIIANREVISYLDSSLRELTRFSKSKFETHKIEELNIEPINTEIINIIIPSMRVDSIVSEIIKTSRSKTIEIINSERVFINSELITKNSKMLKENDMVTIRGKGRFKIKQVLNSTKRGNLVLEVEKYI